ncbi:hypothetical protein Q8G81_32765, partial [Klebsiella pneumoniae]
NSMRIIYRATFVVKINVRRCVAADFQVSGVDGSELCIAILPENLPCSRYSGTESNPLTEYLRLCERVCCARLR